MAAVWLLAALLIGPMVADGQGSSAPVYSAESVANTAANIAGYYSPNTFITIYGDNLGVFTRAVSGDEIRGKTLPTTLSGTGVRVLVNSTPSFLYYVSPRQVNLLLSSLLSPGRTTVQLVHNGLAGPLVTITLTSTAPAFFQSDAKTIIATHANGALVDASNPARQGETIVLWADGLGPTNPAAQPGSAAISAAEIVDKANFRLLLNGTAVEARRILYAGVSPGFAGLFQVNVQLPDDAPKNPEIRMSIGDQISPPDRVLVLQ